MSKIFITKRFLVQTVMLT